MKLPREGAKPFGVEGGVQKGEGREDLTNTGATKGMGAEEEIPPQKHRGWEKQTGSRTRLGWHHQRAAGAMPKDKAVNY